MSYAALIRPVTTSSGWDMTDELSQGIAEVDAGGGLPPDGPRRRDVEVATTAGTSPSTGRWLPRNGTSYWPASVHCQDERA
jgi:hypothetical protein